MEISKNQKSQNVWDIEKFENLENLENIFEFNRIINPGKKYLPPVGICLRNSENKIVGFLGLMSSTNNDNNYNPAIGVSLIMVGSLAIYKSFTRAFYSKDKQTYDFNKIPAEKKKEILIRLIEHGELWSKSST